MRYWWVNQNQTYRAEVRGSFMWSPKRNANGARNQGDGLQSVYLAEVPQPLADVLIGLIGQAYWDAYSTIAVLQTVAEPVDLESRLLIAGRPVHGVDDEHP